MVESWYEELRQNLSGGIEENHNRRQLEQSLSESKF